MINHAAHQVTKVTITSEHRFQSSGKERISREIRISFENGQEQVIDLYSAENIENLTVEIK